MDDLALESQLCFALYAASRVTQGAYREVLQELGLTYPQYLVLLVLWQGDGIGVKELGGRLLLDSGTLSPLLRRLEERGVVTRTRSEADARQVEVHLTAEGDALRDRVGEIRRCLGESLHMDPQDIRTLRDLARQLVTTSTDHTSPTTREGIN